MIKILLAGIWVCVVSLAASYYAISWKMGEAPETEHEQFFGGLDSVKTKMISVPVVVNGVVEGYVMAQFVFTVEAKLMRRLSVKPDVFLVDEAFRTIYAGDGGNFRRPKKQDLDHLASTMKESVNKRFGAKFVEDVLVEEVSFVSKEDVREGVKQQSRAQRQKAAEH